jgi:enoyl-CoA hydratase/carnithine racemase
VTGAAPSGNAADRVTVRLDHGIAQISLANPGRRNAFTWKMYDQLAAIAESLAGRQDLTAVVVRGDPADGFAAGTDIRQFTGFSSGADGVRYERRIGAVMDKLLAIPVPTIALVEGAAVGAGLVVALCCDVVIAERGARFGAPIARTLGNCLPAAVVARLRSRVGINLAAGMLLTATLIPAETLAASGFVFQLVDPGGLAPAADALLGRIGGSAPLTLRALKTIMQQLDAAAPVPGDDDLLAHCYASADFREGVAAFLESRPPAWTGT